MVKKKQNVFYITTAIDYPNGKPHLGHAFEKLITDCYARWYRLHGYDTFFLTGTDENSQKIVDAAADARKPVKEFLEENVAVFKQFAKMLNISNDDFIRTTEQRHVKTAQMLFEKVRKKGDIYKGVYKGQYCTPCESFWTETQLAEGKCPQCKRKTRYAEEEAYFFQMSKYQPQLLVFLEEHPDFIVPQARRNEILSRLKEPLRDLCVSRSTIHWGILLPHDQKHVIYVWFDALINYLSALEYPGEKYKRYWKEAMHVIGKDISWFHCVIWPCILMACEIPLPKQIMIHGFINDKHGEKMSKSKGNVIEPSSLLEKYGADVLRYYLLRTVPGGEDGKFDEEELLERYNNELANDLGNVVKRIQALLKKEGGKMQKGTAQDAFHSERNDAALHMLMEQREHHRAIEEIWSFIKKINAYLNEHEPWKISDKERRKEVVYNAAEALRFATCYLSAFLPVTAEKIAEQLHFEIENPGKSVFGKGVFSVQKEEMLFPKFEREEEEKKKEEKIEHTRIFPLNLKVAKILEVKDHPEADKLYVLQLDVGSEKRQVCAGIKPFYKKEELLNKQVILVSNLKKAKLRGIESNGMLLAAGENARILTAPKSKPGESVFIEDYQNRTSQIRYDDFLEVELKTKDKKVEVLGKFLKTKTESIQVDAEDGLRVK
ncbi:methionine--tRNA ligase [Candidatus Woesearchaeota archaeon]|nr:methionine--tRNA ligase [Candidatus Woesearchaeota archaeon]